MVDRKFHLILVALFFFSFASALDSPYCADVSVDSIHPSSVSADEEFTVGLQVENCGEGVSEIAMIEIVRHSKEIEIKEPLLLDIGKLNYANSKRQVVYHMYTSQDISPGEHVFEAKLVYGSNEILIEKKFNFSITVISQKSDLAISKINFEPKKIFSSEDFTLTIDIENAEKGNAKSLKVSIEDLENFEGIKQDYLGELEEDEVLPAEFYLISSPSSGLYNGKIIISYKEFGELKSSEFPFQVQIFEKSNLIYYVLGLSTLLLILGTSVYSLYGRKKNELNKSK